MFKKINWPRLVLSLAGPQVIGYAGMLFTKPALNDWYANLDKVSFNPPNWVFGAVWPVLYLLMGVSVYLIWQQTDKLKQKQEKRRAHCAVWLFWFHLLFNFSWTAIFFIFKNTGLALLNLLVLVALIVMIMKEFWHIKRAAAYLLWPYLLWVFFALALNYAIWLLNM